ncbi:Protein of unknown function [Bacillus mycoides]|nr:Protein of unknown function [Bacillus mycoides]
MGISPAKSREKNGASTEKMLP